MPDNFLSQNEVDALLEGVGDAGAVPADPGAPAGVQAYSLIAQERVARNRMPMLDTVHERFSRQFRIALNHFLRRDVEISVGPLRVCPCGEFIRNLPAPASLNLVHIPPLCGTALVVFNHDLVFLLVDNLFGGDGRFHAQIEGREFTQTEHRIVRRVLDIAFECFAEAWKPVYPIRFEFIRAETNTRLINIATAGDAMVTLNFGIQLGQVGGELQLCMPYTMIEPIKDLLTGGLQAVEPALDKRWSQLMRQQVQLAEVELVADLGTAHISLRDIVHMKVGDVIPLDIPHTIEGKVDGVPVMACAYGKFNGQYTLRVEKLLPTAAGEPLTSTASCRPGT